MIRSYWSKPTIRFVLPTGVLTIALMALASFSTVAGNETQRAYSFGVVPQQSATKLARLWAPLLKHLREQTDCELRFKTAPNIPVFEQRLAKGEYDFAYMNPYHYTVFNRNPGYVAFAKEKDKRLTGIIVVAREAPYRDLSELAGATVAFPAPAAFAASVLPRAYFRSQGIPITPKYVSSHDSVYRSVAKGLYPAGGGVERTLLNLDPEVRAQLRVLWTTDGYTPHAFAAHPGVPHELVVRLQLAMLSLEQDTKGRELLRNLSFKGITAALDSEWDDVRALGIELLNGLVTE